MQTSGLTRQEIKQTLTSFEVNIIADHFGVSIRYVNYILNGERKHKLAPKILKAAKDIVSFRINMINNINHYLQSAHSNNR